MPVVPYEPAVREQGLPNVRFDPSTPNLTGLASAQIEGSTAIAKAAGGVLDSFLKFAEDEKRKGDQLAVLDADKQLGDLETQLLHGPTGALNKRGKDAFGTPDEVSKVWNKQTAEIEKNLANNDQRAAFMKARASRQQDVNSQLQRHVSSETRKYDDEVTTSFVNNERNAAGTNYLDNERINRSINRQGNTLIDYANRNGKGQEWIDEKTLDASSKTHMLVMGRMLANGEDQFAEQYYKTSAKGMTGDDRKDIERALEQGRTLGQAQRIALDVSSRVPNMGLAQEEIDKMGLHPKVKEKAMDMTRERYAIRERAEDKARGDTYEEYAYALRSVGQQGALSEFNRIQQDPRYVDLNESQRVALDRTYNEVSSAKTRANDNKAWLDFLELSSGEITALSRADFETQFWSKFDDARQRRAEHIWDATRKQNDRDPKVTSTLSFNHRVENTLRTSGLVPADKEKSKFSKEEASNYARFEQSAARAVENFELTELQGKRKATGEEIQKIIDPLAIEKVFIDVPWGYDKEKPAVILTDEERGQAYVPMASVPVADRNAIEQAIRDSGKRVTVSKIERAYAAYKMKNKTRFQSIIAE